MGRLGCPHSGGYHTGGYLGKNVAVKPPAPKGPVFLYFVDVTEDDLAKLSAAGSKTEVRQLLKDFLSIDQSDGFRTEILCDMHYHNYAFCMSRNFSADKTSTFLSIMKYVLEEAIERKLPMDEAFNVFKGWLLKHSVERPLWSVGIFAFDDVQAITNHVHATFFRNYKMYMYVYMTRSDIDFRVDRGSGAGLSAPRRFAPLTAATEVNPQEENVFNQLLKLGVVNESARPEQPNDANDAANDEAEKRAALIKQKVDEEMERLMAGFEEQLSQQDEDFKKMIAAH